MSKVGRWSTAAGSNNASPPNGWPEGQLPSTVNDCAREMMASIRTYLLDAQFVDQDMTPTFLTATSFSVPGNQTSAIHIGRRLKCFDATAGVQQIIYGTVTSVSFTAVTTIHIEADSGSLTASLSSFGISIISNVNNALPRQSDLTVSTIAVTGGLSISGAAVMGGAIQGGSTLSISGAATFQSTLTVSGAAAFGSTVSITQTLSAAAVVSTNTLKAAARCIATAGGLNTESTFGINSISLSGTGIVRFNFSTAFPDLLYVAQIATEGAVFLSSASATLSSHKISIRAIADSSLTINYRLNASFYDL